MRGENILAHPRFAVGTKYEVARTDYNFIFCPYSKTSLGLRPNILSSLTFLNRVGEITKRKNT